MLHSFGEGTDGVYPDVGLVFDASGNLYGATALGGVSAEHGAVFKINPQLQDQARRVVVSDGSIHRLSLD